MLLPHRLEIRPSRHLALALTLLHLAAAGSLLPLALPQAFKVVLAAAVMTSYAASIRRHALLRAHSSVRELVLKADGSVEATGKDGGRFDARVSGRTTVLSWLIVLLLEIPGRQRLLSVVIVPDTLSAEDGRLLRAWLRRQLT